MAAGRGKAATKAAANKVSNKAEQGEGRDKALQRTLEHIEKQFGVGSVQRLDSSMVHAVPSISTGALTVDLALGVGGLPRGRVVEIYGPESSGKTTLALTVAANAQREGGIAAIIDAEHALDPVYARKIGVKIDELLVSQPDSGEQALEITEQLVRSNAVDVLIVDSVAALVPQAEITGEMGAAHVGLQARLMSQALRKLTAAVARSKAAVIFINQLREKIGVMFGSPETTPGGRALKFYASVRLDVRRVGAIRDGDKIMGSQVRAKIVKNKVAPPFRQGEFEIIFDSGISWEGSLLDVALREEVLNKSGAWLAFGTVKLGNGREKARRFLCDNPETAKELYEAIKKKLAENETAARGKA